MQAGIAHVRDSFAARRAKSHGRSTAGDETLVDRQLIFWSYIQIGVYQTLVGYLAYFLVSDLMKIVFVRA